MFRGLCYTVLLIPFVSERGLSVAALKSALTMLKAVLSSSSSRGAAHICGHVLGLRIQRAACIVEVTVRARQAPEYDWEAGHRLASSPAEGTGEQATGRVDVPGEAHGIFKQKIAAASLTAASQHTPVLTARCVGSPLEQWKKTIQYLESLFVTSWANRCPSGFQAKSLVMSCLWLSLLQRVLLHSSFS